MCRCRALHLDHLPHQLPLLLHRYIHPDPGHLRKSFFFYYNIGNIQTFCVFISVAVAYDYVYQVVLYSAILVQGGKREAARKNAYLPCLPPVPMSNPKKTKDSCWVKNANTFLEWILDTWVDFCMGFWSKAILSVGLLVYWSFMVYGVLQIKVFKTSRSCNPNIQVGLSSEKLFLDDSPLLDLVRIQTNIIFKEGGQVGQWNKGNRLALGGCFCQQPREHERTGESARNHENTTEIRDGQQQRRAGQHPHLAPTVSALRRRKSILFKKSQKAK